MAVADLGSGGGGAHDKEGNWKPEDIERLNKAGSPESSGEMSVEHVIEAFLLAIEKEAAGAKTRLLALNQKQEAGELDRVLERVRHKFEALLAQVDKPTVTEEAHDAMTHSLQDIENIEMGRSRVQSEPAAVSQEKPTQEIVEVNEKADDQNIIGEQLPDRRSEKIAPENDDLDDLIQKYNKSDLSEALADNQSAKKVAEEFASDINRKAGHLIDTLKSEGKHADIQKKMSLIAARAQDDMMALIEAKVNDNEKLDKLQDIKLNANIELGKLKLDADYGFEDEEQDEKTEESSKVVELAGPEKKEDKVKSKPKQRRLRAFLQGAGVAGAAAAAGTALYMATQNDRPVKEAEKTADVPGEVAKEGDEAEAQMSRDDFYRIFNAMADQNVTEEQKAAVNKLRVDHPELYRTYMDAYIEDVFHTADGISAQELKNILDDRFIPHADKTAFLDWQVDQGKIFLDKNGQYSTEQSHEPLVWEGSEYDYNQEFGRFNRQKTSPRTPADYVTVEPESEMPSTKAPVGKVEGEEAASLDDFLQNEESLYSIGIFEQAKDREMLDELYLALTTRNETEAAQRMIADLARDRGFTEGNKAELFAGMFQTERARFDDLRASNKILDAVVDGMAAFDTRVIRDINAVKKAPSGHWNIVKIEDDYVLIQKFARGYIIDRDGDYSTDGIWDNDNVLENKFQNGI